jgi:hypothetical protein
MRIVFLLALSLAVTACGSSPGSGDLVKEAGASDRYTESWSGGPFTASNPVVNQDPVRACPAEGSGTPVCDYHRITPAAGVKNIVVAIKPNEGFEADDYDLWVYDDQDQLVGAQATGGGNESTLFPHNGSAYYEVRVQPYTVGIDSGYSGVATQSDQTIDSEITCDTTVLSGENYPDTIGIAGVTDGGERIELSVTLLLDGIDPALALNIMEIAKQSYAPLSIDLVLKEMRPATIISTVSGDIIQEAKDLTGGAPPAGSDIVGVLTTKEMQSATGGAGTVLGQADCIGGIRAPYNSYFVATVGPEDPFDLGGFLLSVDQGPETVAHEMGHLMGAHHHYGNCAEGVSPEDAERSDISPCDLMFPSVEPLSLNFAAFPGAVVRGHAVDYAAP